MNALLELLKPLLVAVVTDSIVKFLNKIQTDPDFAKKAEVVRQQVNAATTKEETDAASKALHDLISGA